MEGIFIVVLLILIFVIFGTLSSVIYFTAIMDIGFRLLTFIGNNIGVSEIKSLVYKYVPLSIPDIIDKYTNGILNTIVMWIYILVMVVFLFYIIRTFIRKESRI